MSICVILLLMEVLFSIACVKIHSNRILDVV